MPEVYPDYTAVIATIHDNGVGEISLNQPKTLNALSVQLMTQMRTALRRMENDDRVKVILFTHQGRGFCSGADLKGGFTIGDASDPTQLPLEVGHTGHVCADNMYAHHNRCSGEIYRCKKTTIGVIDGMCAGGGCGIAGSMDILLVSENARFVLVFMQNLGIAPDMGSTWGLMRSMGRAKAWGHIITGEPITGAEAEKYGFAYKCLPSNRLDSYARELADKLAKGVTTATPTIRELVDSAYRNEFEMQLNFEARTQENLAAQPHFMEGISRFNSKSKM
eukprot:Clim_evm38s229 gene=Clim_evmTU38s229